MNFKGLDQVAFFVMRHLDQSAVQLVKDNYAWAVGVPTGFPNYVEVWGFR